MQLIETNIYLLEGFEGNRLVLVTEIGGKTFSEPIEYDNNTNLAKEIYGRLSWMFNNQFFLLPLLQDYVAKHEIKRKPCLTSTGNDSS